MFIWGVKTEASFDVWSIEHLVMGISVGWLADKISTAMIRKVQTSDSLRTKINLIIVLLVAFIWECLEHYLETGLWGKNVEYWFQGVEHWSNRLIFDNVMVVLGWYIYGKKDRLIWFARVFSVVWLTSHILVFPHSMYLHRIFN